jgi:hypothetical protein
MSSMASEPRPRRPDPSRPAARALQLPKRFEVLSNTRCNVVADRGCRGLLYPDPQSDQMLDALSVTSEAVGPELSDDRR